MVLEEWGKIATARFLVVGGEGLADLRGVVGVQCEEVLQEQLILAGQCDTGGACALFMEPIGEAEETVERGGWVGCGWIGVP